MVENEKKRTTAVKNLTTVASTIENILSDLSSCEVFQPAAKNQTETCNKVKDVEPNIPVKLPVIPHVIKISFKEVIGNFEAKQALYENVILPLTISDIAKVKIFSGEPSSLSSAPDRYFFFSYSSSPYYRYSGWKWECDALRSCRDRQDYHVPSSCL